MTKQSIKAAVRTAKSQDTAARNVKSPVHSTSIGAATHDSFVNFAHKLGVGADNALTSSTYGYNPITRNRQLLEFMYRGSWIAGVAVDVVANDMTRSGVNFLTEIDPTDADKIEESASTNGSWDKFNECLKWGRLYGGAIAVMLVDGQDMKTPLRVETVGKGQYKGMLVLDRWMVEPSLADLVTDFGPNLGKPKYYTVQSNAPALRGQLIHYSRVALRHEGVKMPYQQALTENLWGISVLERMYDRMIAFDSASTGAAQLVFKAHLRTLSVPGLRDIIAAGGAPMNGIVAYTDMMRRFQGIEGMTLIDGEDEFTVQGAGTGAMSGVDKILGQLAQQVSGGLGVPMTRLFGQAPGGLSTDDKSGERTYFDKIRQEQRTDMSYGVNTDYRLTAQSAGIRLPDDFSLDFASLYEMSDQEKADVATKTVEAVSKAKDSGFISDQVAVKELRQSSRTTGIFTNITEADINAADDQTQPPVSEMDLAKLKLGVDQENAEAKAADKSKIARKPLPKDD